MNSEFQRKEDFRKFLQRKENQQILNVTWEHCWKCPDCDWNLIKDFLLKLDPRWETLGQLVCPAHFSFLRINGIYLSLKFRNERFRKERWISRAKRI